MKLQERFNPPKDSPALRKHRIPRCIFAHKEQVGEMAIEANTFARKNSSRSPFAC